VTTFLFAILAQENQGGGNITGLLIILIPMGAILYMTIMPQRKQRQKQAALLAKLEVGDEVITTGGIIGTITFVEADLYHIEIDTDVVIRIAKSGVARSLAEPAEAEKGKSGSKGASRSRKGLLAGALGGQASGVDEDADATAEQSDEAPNTTSSDPDAPEPTSHLSASEGSEVDSQASSQQINKK
jgi:preprotein translocase subunit YajC